MDSRLIVSLKNAKNFYGSKIKVLSPAKLNLYLNIIGKYPSGFHKIESIFERVSLFDEITLTVSRQKEVRISCNKKNLENEENLCVKAAKLLQSRFKIKCGFDIELFKRIPAGSGLGGGSSDAASTILAIDKLCKLKLNREDLYELGACLGSDVNFFLAQSSFAEIHNRGEKVIPIEGRQLKHIIIWPGVSLSTKVVYAHYRVKLTKFLNNVKMLRYALKKGDENLIECNIFNALEKSALSLCPELSIAKEKLFGEGIVARVTGSGSALYTISNLPVRRIKNLLPKNWFIGEVLSF